MSDSSGDARSLRDRIESIVGSRIVSSRCAPAGRFMLAERWTVLFADGSRRFVKLADDAASRHEIRAEAVVLGAVQADFTPVFFGFDDHPLRPLLVVEDLAGAQWPPPWQPGDIELVGEALDRVHDRQAPGGLAPVEAVHHARNGWPVVAGDPSGFLRLGLGGSVWLERNLDALVDAAATAPIGGDALIHLDVRSDNLCLVGRRVVFVDWARAAVGNPALDLALWLPSLPAEGGPEPDAMFRGDPRLPAFVAGAFAARAGQPPARWGAGTVRVMQRRILATALPWACRALGIEQPI